MSSNRTEGEKYKMGRTTLTDSEAHELVMKRFDAMTHDDWQARIAAAKAAFDSQEAEERGYSRNGSHVKPEAAHTRAQKVTEVVVG